MRLGLRSWLWIALLSLTVLFLYRVRHALTPFLIALFIVYLLSPAVDRLVKLRIRGRTMPRALAVSLVLSVVIGLLAALLSFLVPALIREVGPFQDNFSTFTRDVMDRHLPTFSSWVERKVGQAGFNIDIQQEVADRSSRLLESEDPVAYVISGLRSITLGIFNAIFEIILVFIITLFTLLDLPKFKTWFWGLIPEDLRVKIGALVLSLDKDLSGYIRGQLTICLVNFVLTTLGLLLLDVRYAITLGFVAGVFSIIPVFGSIISTIPIVLVSLTSSVWMAVKAILVIIGIHLLEANVLNPKIIGYHVKLHPVLIMFSLVVAEHFFGPLGMLVGVPVAAGIRSLLHFGAPWLFGTQSQVTIASEGEGSASA